MRGRESCERNWAVCLLWFYDSNYFPPASHSQILSFWFCHIVPFNAVVFDVLFFLYFISWLVSFSSPILSLFFSCAWLMAAVLHFFRSIFLRNCYMKKWKIWKKNSSTSVYSFSHKHITKLQQCITAHCSSWHHFEQRCADLKVILWFFVSLLWFLLLFYSFDAVVYLLLTFILAVDCVLMLLFSLCCFLLFVLWLSLWLCWIFALVVICVVVRVVPNVL